MASYTCPGCGAVSDFSAERCPYCGNPFVPALGAAADDEETIRRKLVEFEAKAAQSPNNGKALFDLGKAYHRLGQYQKAQDSLAKAAALLPKHAEIYYLLAYNMGLMDGWQATGVAENARKALGLDPKLTPAESLLALNRGMSIYLFEQSDDNAERALAEFRKALALDPKNTYAYFCAGCIFEENDDLETAAGMFEQAAALSTDDGAPGREDARIFARTGYLYSKLGQEDKARKFLKDAVRLDPDNAAAQSLLANV